MSVLHWSLIQLKMRIGRGIFFLPCPIFVVGLVGLFGSSTACWCSTPMIPLAHGDLVESGAPAFVVLGPEALGLSTMPIDLHLLPDGRVLVVSHSHPELSKGGAEIAAFQLYSEILSRPDCGEAWFLGCDQRKFDHCRSPASHRWFEFLPRRSLRVCQTLGWLEEYRASG